MFVEFNNNYTMPFLPGKSGNPKGKPLGARSEKTLQWEALGEALLTKHSERANQILASLDDDKFLDHYGKLLEYFKPKQARTEVKQEGTTEVIIRVVEDGADGQEAQTT